MDQLKQRGQDPLRRLVELRRLAHRARERDRRARGTRSGLATEQSSTTCSERTIELEVIPAVPRVRHGLDPVQPARRRPAGRRAVEKVERGPPLHRVPAASEIEENRDRLERWEKLCGELGERPADVALAWLLAPAGRDRADHRAAHRGAAAQLDARARDPAGRGRARASSTRSSRARAAPRPRPTPGERTADRARPCS